MAKSVNEGAFYSDLDYRETRMFSGLCVIYLAECVKSLLRLSFKAFCILLYLSAVSLNDGHIFDIIFSDDYIMDIIGALECENTLFTNSIVISFSIMAICFSFLFLDLSCKWMLDAHRYDSLVSFVPSFDVIRIG